MVGTLTFNAEGPDAKGGTVTWMGQAYLDDGTRVGGAGTGVFEEIGNQKWRVRTLIGITDGSVLLTDGEVSLDGRSYNGTIQEWS